MRTGWLALILTCALSGLHGQERLKLHMNRAVPVADVYANFMMAPFRCDADNNAYFIAPQFQPTASSGIVLRVSADGQRVTRYNLNSVTDIKSTGLVEYAVGSPGEVYALTQDQRSRDTVIVKFDKNGAVKSVIRLNTSGIVPRQLGVLPSGSFFLAGLKYQQTDHGAQVHPYTSMFNERGQFLQPIRLAGDLKPDPKDAKVVIGSSLGKYESELDQSLAVRGDDGQLYFVRFGPKALVFALSAAGEVHELFALSPPSPRSELADVRVAGGRMAVEYVESDNKTNQTAKVYINIVDLATGETVQKYWHQDWRIGVALACYSPEDFTFLSAAENGQLQLVHAVP